MKTKEEPRESPTGNSFLTQFTECPKKWAFKYLMQWLPDKEKSSKDYLVFGQAFHLFKEWFYLNPLMIEEWFSNKIDSDSVVPLEGQEKGLEYLRKYSSSFEKSVNKELEERLETAIDIWINAYGKEEHERYEVIGTELENILTLPNGFKISVRYDALLRERSTGFVYVFDTKTTRAPLIDTIEKYRYNSQPFIYCSSIIKSDFEWKNDFRGWITDAIFQRKYVKDGWRIEIKRSEPVLYTESEVNELLKSLTLLTDEMLFCTESFVNDKKTLGESFRMDRSKCYAKYTGLCPYYYDCLKKQTFEDKNEIPLTYSQDKWTGFQVIQDNLSGICKNEKTPITGMD